MEIDQLQTEKESLHVRFLNFYFHTQEYLT